MAFGQSSFRRILLSRLLLLSVPVLVMGVYVTYRKARSASLESARQNLTESAVLKGENIAQTIEALRANLVTASDSIVLNSGSFPEHQGFVERLATQLPMQIECVQLITIATHRATASTCEQQPLSNYANVPWPQKQKLLLPQTDVVQVESFLGTDPAGNSDRSKRQLRLVFGAPVYMPNGQLRYVLSVRAALLQLSKAAPGSLKGNPVVINEAGTILAHPFPQRIGRNIEQEDDADRLKSLMNGALSGRQDFLHLFAFEKNGVELVAGYSAIANPISQESGQKWVILALTPLELALAPLQDIQQVLSYFVLALLGASFLATLYIAAALAHPLEKLRDYALNIEYMTLNKPIPQNFRIREFQQLALALSEMVERLQTGAQEILLAWQEARQANDIKSEFLATTSHELRTPLNGIINSIRIVLEGYCDSREEEQDFLHQADDAAIHLLGIINDVLDISKIEAGKLTVKLESLDLRQLLEEVLELHMAQIQRKALKLQSSFIPGKVQVNADPARLKQVLINILGNAIKFTESGQITVIISLGDGQDLRPSPKDLEVSFKESHYRCNPESPHPELLPQSRFESSGPPAMGVNHAFGLDMAEAFVFPPNGRSPNPAEQSWVTVTVQDTGIGIDPAQQQKLFRPFVMVDGSKTRRFGGTGLGLAISRNLIGLMGGSIQLFSPGEGHGTTVQITLPLVKYSMSPEMSSSSMRSV